MGQAILPECGERVANIKWSLWSQERGTARDAHGSFSTQAGAQWVTVCFWVPCLIR
jgi:hypothetical protein